MRTDPFDDMFHERSIGIRFFLDWLMANKDKYDFDQDMGLDIKLYDDYVDFWKALSAEDFVKLTASEKL